MERKEGEIIINLPNGESGSNGAERSAWQGLKRTRRHVRSPDHSHLVIVAISCYFIAADHSPNANRMVVKSVEETRLFATLLQDPDKGKRRQRISRAIALGKNRCIPVCANNQLSPAG
jgi:hypothetical protein